MRELSSICGQGMVARNFLCGRAAATCTWLCVKELEPLANALRIVLHSRPSNGAAAPCVLLVAECHNVAAAASAALICGGWLCGQRSKFPVTVAVGSLQSGNMSGPDCNGCIHEQWCCTNHNLTTLIRRLLRCLVDLAGGIHAGCGQRQGSTGPVPAGVAYVMRQECCPDV